jgi:hypothetical protein
MTWTHMDPISRAATALWEAGQTGIPFGKEGTRQ